MLSKNEEEQCSLTPPTRPNQTPLKQIVKRLWKSVEIYSDIMLMSREKNYLPPANRPPVEQWDVQSLHVCEV